MGFGVTGVIWVFPTVCYRLLDIEMDYGSFYILFFTHKIQQYLLPPTLKNFFSNYVFRWVATVIFLAHPLFRVPPQQLLPVLGLMWLFVLMRRPWCLPATPTDP